MSRKGCGVKTATRSQAEEPCSQRTSFCGPKGLSTHRRRRKRKLRRSGSQGGSGSQNRSGEKAAISARISFQWTCTQKVWVLLSGWTLSRAGRGDSDGVEGVTDMGMEEKRILF